MFLFSEKLAVKMGIAHTTALYRHFLLYNIFIQNESVFTRFSQKTFPYRKEIPIFTFFSKCVLIIYTHFSRRLDGKTNLTPLFFLA